MSLTKAEARDLVREFLDDPDSARWGDTNLDLLIGLVLDDLWGELLEVAPNHLSKLDTVSSDSVTSPGYVDLSDSGPLTERFFRLQSAIREEQEFSPVDPRDVVIEDDEVIVQEAADYTYYVRGSQLWLFPLDDDEGIELWYSYLPTGFDDLDESASVTFPDGFENAYVLEAAGRAMLKGDREDPSNLLSMARTTFERALRKVQRAHPGPQMPFTTSTPTAWGSVE